MSFWTSFWSDLLLAPRSRFTSQLSNRKLATLYVWTVRHLCRPVRRYFRRVHLRKLSQVEHWVRGKSCCALALP
jgi:hypothetical protein